MSAEIPEEVHIFPSTTHLATATQLTFGPKAIVSSQARLFVVAYFPSSTPAPAAIPAHVQIVMRYWRQGYRSLTKAIVELGRGEGAT